MDHRNAKRIGSQKPGQQSILKENWEVMKPFVHFSVKALGLLAGALIGIIKLLPMLKPDSGKPKKDTRIIKI